MPGLARGGGGNHELAEEGDTAGRLIARRGRRPALADRPAVGLIIRPTGDVAGLRLWNDPTTTGIEGGAMIEFGGFYGVAARKPLPR